MPTGSLKWTPLGTTQFVKFYDPANPATTFTPQINPQEITMNPGNVRQYQGTVNGASTIIGKREYPPAQIQLSWSQMDITDFEGIAFFTSLSPVVYVDNNDNGYLGVLVITQAGQVNGMSSNVWSATMNFLVLGPFNGQHTTLHQLTPNSASLAAANGGLNTGFIPNGTTIKFWLTELTKWGESLVSNVVSQTTSHNNDSIVLTWTPSTSNYYTASKLYWYTSNTSSAATFLTEVQTGQVGSFTVYVPYVQYSLANPPVYGSAYMGFWIGGQFYDDYTH